MKDHKHLLWIFVLSFLILIIQTFPVAALGISPGRTLVEFTPGLEKTIPLTVVNTEHKAVDIILYPEGELASYVTLSQERLSFIPTESEKQVTYTVRLPPSLAGPGIHSARITAREISGEEQQEETIVVKVLLAVASAFDVRVPYPGKYVKAQFYVSSSEEQQSSTFLIQAHNLGTDDIIRASATITIVDEDNQPVAALETDQLSIAAGKRVEFLETWETNNSYGSYTARLHLLYDGQSLTENQGFSVGTFALEPLSVSVKDFTLGDVAKFNILVRNKADAPLQRVTAGIVLSDAEEKSIADFSSVGTIIPGGAVQALLAYWDTEGIHAGSYDGKLTLTADTAQMERRIRTTVTEKAITTELLDITGHAVQQPLLGGKALKKEATFALITLLLVIVNSVGWYFYFKRKDKKKLMDDF